MLAVCNARIIFFIYTKRKEDSKTVLFLLSVEKAANLTLNDLSPVGLGFIPAKGCSAQIGQLPAVLAHV